ncbi:Hypothetical_protein [Hexamita inflata]|uniref:Hypothetical_protein n=1 Tax=Hexamita inflata TaxID=28002 RepID=A0AA86VBP8_9EUKA|nr:Hypothetical protein HINF_LOCUS49818 [Hexamita inflata]
MSQDEKSQDQKQQVTNDENILEQNTLKQDFTEQEIINFQLVEENKQISLQLQEYSQLYYKAQLQIEELQQKLQNKYENSESYQLKLQITDLTIQNTDLSKKLEISDTFKNSAQNLQEQLKNANEQIGDLQHSLKTAQNDMQTLQTQQSKLNTNEVNNLDSNNSVSALQLEITQLKEQNQLLSQELQNLNQLQNISPILKNSSSEIANPESALTILTTQLTEQKQLIITLQSDNAALLAQNTTLNSNLLEMTEVDQMLQDHAQMLLDINQRQKNDLSGAEQTINDLKNECEQLKMILKEVTEKQNESKETDSKEEKLFEKETQIDQIQKEQIVYEKETETENIQKEEKETKENVETEKELNVQNEESEEKDESDTAPEIEITNVIQKEENHQIEEETEKQELTQENLNQPQEYVKEIQIQQEALELSCPTDTQKMMNSQFELLNSTLSQYPIDNLQKQINKLHVQNNLLQNQLNAKIIQNSQLLEQIQHIGGENLKLNQKVEIQSRMVTSELQKFSQIKKASMKQSKVEQKEQVKDMDIDIKQKMIIRKLQQDVQNLNQQHKLESEKLQNQINQHSSTIDQQISEIMMLNIQVNHLQAAQIKNIDEIHQLQHQNQELQEENKNQKKLLSEDQWYVRSTQLQQDLKQEKQAYEIQVTKLNNIIERKDSEYDALAEKLKNAMMDYNQIKIKFQMLTAPSQNHRIQQLDYKLTNNELTHLSEQQKSRISELENQLEALKQQQCKQSKQIQQTLNSTNNQEQLIFQLSTLMKLFSEQNEFNTIINKINESYSFEKLQKFICEFDSQNNIISEDTITLLNKILKVANPTVKRNEAKIVKDAPKIVINNGELKVANSKKVLDKQEMKQASKTLLDLKQPNKWKK